MEPMQTKCKNLSAVPPPSALAIAHINRKPQLDDHKLAGAAATIFCRLRLVLSNARALQHVAQVCQQNAPGCHCTPRVVVKWNPYAHSTNLQAKCTSQVHLGPVWLQATSARLLHFSPTSACTHPVDAPPAVNSNCSPGPRPLTTGTAISSSLPLQAF